MKKKREKEKKGGDRSTRVFLIGTRTISVSLQFTISLESLPPFFPLSISKSNGYGTNKHENQNLIDPRFSENAKMSFDPVPSNTHHNLDEQIVQLMQSKPLSEQEGFVSSFGVRYGKSTMNDQSQMMNQHQMLNSQMVSQINPPQMMNPMVSQSQMVAQSNMMSQSYGNWPHQLPNMPPMSSLKFPNQMNQMYGASKSGRGNWKGKKVIENKRKDGRRKDMILSSGTSNVGPGAGASGAIGAGYKPPTLNELEHQNRLKARRFYPKKKFNRMGPYAHAPRNTTSYLIRAKKEGGIASLVSPCPVTPAVLPTPVFSPSREALVDMAKEEWGVDGYGSMKGLIRLRSSPGHEADMDDYEDEDDGGSSESDVEEHLEVERRLDHDLSRFEMIYPNYGTEYNNVLENRVDDQDTHIAQLEEENLSLKERLYLMEREFGEIKRRMQFLERQNQIVGDINEEEVENVSEYGSEGTKDVHLLEEKHNEVDGRLHSEGTEHGGGKEGIVGKALNSQHATSIVKEPCQDGSLEYQGIQADFTDTKEAALPDEKADLEMVKNKGEIHDMVCKGDMTVEDCNVQKVDSIESIVGKVINFGIVEMDVGKNVAENDDAENVEAAEDKCLEDSTPNMAQEDGPSVQ